MPGPDGNKKPANNYAKTPGNVGGKVYDKTPANVGGKVYAKTPANVGGKVYDKTPANVGGKKPSGPYGVAIPASPGKKPSGPYGVVIPANGAKPVSKPVASTPAPAPAKNAKPKPSGHTVVNSDNWQTSSKAAKVLGSGKTSPDGGIGPRGTYALPGNTAARKGPLPRPKV